jgi:hypothetical protein
MRKINISTEQIGKIVKGGCKLALAAFALALPSLIRENAKTVSYCIGEAKYSDAVNAILNSSMFDSSKTQAMELLKREADSEYYKSVIMAVNSDMFDSTKINTIRMISEK